MKRWLLTLSFLLPCWQLAIPAAGAAEPYLVLVASVQSTVPALSAIETNHLYMSVPLFNDGKAITPLLNYSDSFTQETFMFKVMHMSKQAYERLILARIFRMGGNRPAIYSSLTKLIGALKSNPSAVTYMYSDEASAHPDLKIISVLWKRETEDGND